MAWTPSSRPREAAESHVRAARLVLEGLRAALEPIAQPDGPAAYLVTWLAEGEALFDDLAKKIAVEHGPAPSLDSLQSELAFHEQTLKATNFAMAEAQPMPPYAMKLIADIRRILRDAQSDPDELDPAAIRAAADLAAEGGGWRIRLKGQDTDPAFRAEEVDLLRRLALAVLDRQR